MLPRILHPEQLQGYRLSSHDHCRLALLNRPESGGCTVFLEVHDPCDRVPPHCHHHSAELFFGSQFRQKSHYDGVCAGRGEQI